jgi:hypothetical protein
MGRLNRVCFFFLGVVFYMFIMVVFALGPPHPFFLYPFPPPPPPPPSDGVEERFLINNKGEALGIFDGS